MSEIDYGKIRGIVEEEAAKASSHIQTSMMTKVAKEATKEAVQEMFLVCGIDYENPIEMQKIMAYGKECQRQSTETKKAIDWTKDRMKEGDTLKRGMLNSLGSHIITALVACAAFFGLDKLL